jgi:hypothetical protein
MAGVSDDFLWQPASRVRGRPKDLQLVNWPLRDDPARAWAVLAIAVGAAVGAGVLAGSLPMGSLALGALGISLWRLWIPVKFELGSRGVSQSVFGRRRRIGWSDIPSFEVRSHGVLLLPSREPLLLSRLRGLYIRFAGRREELLASVEYYVSPEPLRGASAEE